VSAPLPNTPVIVDEVTPLPSGNWGVKVTIPGQGTRYMVVPTTIASVWGVQLTAAVVAQLYAAEAADHEARVTNG